MRFVARQIAKGDGEVRTKHRSSFFSTDGRPNPKLRGPPDGRTILSGLNSLTNIQEKTDSVTLRPAPFALVVLIAIACLPTRTSAQITDLLIDDYLNRTLDHALETREDALDRWKERYSELAGATNIQAELIGYQPPNFLALVADISSHLYARTGDERYAQVTRDLLVEIPELRSHFPQAFRTRVEYEIGVPAVNWFRTLPVYAIAYQRTSGSAAYNANDRRTITEAIASSVDIVFAFPEWGAMNRALLRAESFMAAAVTLPDHPSASKWRMMGEILASDNINKWEIEDASIYHAVWLRSYIGYVDLAGMSDAFESPILRFYFDYLKAIIAPDGTIPEFGDGRWDTNLFEYHLVMERAANEFESGQYQWVADRMLERMGGLTRTAAGDLLVGPAFDTPSVGFARTLINRRLHGDSFIQPVEPTDVSGDAIDEMIAKKVVFRSGYDDDATYMMLNYKDEGYSSVMQKDYLKHVLAVAEEKMHHGHSDENSITTYMKDGAYLLYDAGYRPFAPSGPNGAWRSDFYHNRIVVRDKVKGAAEDYFASLINDGAYNEDVRTSKMDYQPLPTVEYSKTRLDDPRTGYRWDRVISRDLAEDFFVVVDAVRYEKGGGFTTANLWHTHRILETGPNWFVTRYDSLAAEDPNPGDLNLLVIFPQERDTGTHPVSRSYQNETAIYQATSGPQAEGDIDAYVTILVPLEPGTDAAAVASRFGIVRHDDRAVGISIARGDTTETLGVKLDYEADLLDNGTRPLYTYESSAVDYGQIRTDADFFHFVPASDSTAESKFAATHLVHFSDGAKVLFDAPQSQFFQVWGKSDVKGRAKWRRWHNH